MKSARKKERQRKYRELHREQLKQREAERRKSQKKIQQSEYDSEEGERMESQQYVQSIASNSNSDNVQQNLISDLHQGNTQHLEITQNVIVDDMTERYTFIIV